MKTLTLTLLLSLAGLSFLCAQNYKLEELTIEDGLTQGMIHDIIQDSLGFMWFATKDGLNRYDGYSFKLYSHFPADSFSLSGHVVNTLFEDSFGRLWVGTHNNGLNIFDRKSERFYKIDYEESPETGLNSDRIFSIEQENDSIFWVGTGSGLCRLDVPLGTSLWQPFQGASLSQRINSYSIEPIPDLNPNGVATCLSKTSDTLYFTINNRLFRLDLKNYKEWEEMSEAVNAQTIELPFGFRSIAMTSDGYLILPTDQEIKIYRNGESWDISLPEGLQGFIPDITIDQNGSVWGASGGLFKILPGNPEGRQVETLFTTKPSFFIPAVCVDRTGVLWLGTNGYGIRKYNPSNKRFNHLLPGTSTRQLYTDQKGRCWVWVSASMRILDPETGNYELPASFPHWIKKATWVINPEPDVFWFHYPIVEDQTALVKINEKTGAVKTYPYTCKGNPNSPLLMDQSGNIWFSSADGQLVIFHSQREQFVYYDMAEWLPEQQENAAVTAFHRREGSENIWTGTQYGLLRLTLQPDGGISHHLFDVDFENGGSLSENYILSISERPGESNQLWIGTKGGGVNRFNIVTGTFRSITTRDGLPNNVAYGLLPDEEGFLWVTTNRGLSKYHPGKGTFKNYTSADGLQSNEFNTFSYHRAKDGRFLIGGVNGVNIFHPKDLQIESLPPKVFITGLNINNQPWQKTLKDTVLKPIELVTEIQLEYHQDQLYFQFSALDFGASENNRYRYQMVGLDEAPVYAGTRREVAYANLSPNQYTFKVWGANNEDVWSTEPAVLAIHISPPWWSTSWAYFIYLALFSALLYFSYRFQVNRDRLKTQLAYEQRETERLAELDRMKSNFFSNITHEFRTPLTLIVEPARKLKAQFPNPKSQKWADLIINNSERMLKLVNQLLDINRLEEGLMPVNLQQTNLNQLLDTVVESYRGAAQDKQIKLVLDISNRSLLKWVEIDSEKVSKIVHNFLSNALKFTPEGGRITLSARKLPESSSLEVSVQDNGPGIAPEHHSKVFDRFYQVDDSSTRTAEGTGIGLALCQELAQKLSGTIHLKSRPGKGACFSLQLPLFTGKAQQKTTAQPKNIPGESQKPANAVEVEPGTTILVVEDNEDLRDFLCSILEDSFEVSTAKDGIEGLQMATKSLPDILISDVMMPRMDGLQMTKKLKGDVRTSHIPVIMLTAKSALESRVAGLETGADAYLPKPFYAEELIAQINNLLKQRSRLQAYFQGNTKGSPAPAVPKLEQNFLQRAKAAMEAHLADEQFTVEQLSQELLLSRSQLHRKLKALTGQTASEFLSNYRLQKAFALLKDTGGTIGEVSVKVGFSTPQYFSTKFKEKYGFSPSEMPKKG